MTLIPTQKFNLSINQADLVKKTIEYERASLSPNTIRSYKSMWKKFEAWCASNQLASLPTSAETVALYIASLGESVSFSTLDSTIAAIEAAHEKAGRSIQGDLSLYKRVRKGIRRVHKANQTLKQAKPLSVLDLKGACCQLPDTLQGCRDKALLTVGFFGAFRRSELVSLDIEHLEFSEKGVGIALLQSKTSDTKETIYLARAKDGDICPVKALRNWIDKTQITEGAIFRSFRKGGKVSARLSGHAVSAIIKTYFGDNYSGHSTRRGLLTSSAEKNTPIHIMKKLGRHNSIEMIQHYIDTAQGFEDSAVTILGV